MANKRGISEESIKKCHFSLGKEKTILANYKTLQQLHFESAQLFESRNKLFAECWSTIDSHIQEIICTEHNKIINDVLLFISNSKEKLDKLVPPADVHICDRQMLHSSVELFTAAVVAGVNLSDHQQLFQQLTEEVKARTTPHLAVLRARVCNSGIKATMKSIITQLMMSEDQVLSGSEEDDHFPVPRSGRKRIRTPRARRTVQHHSDSEDSDGGATDEVHITKSRRRALFKSPKKTEESSVDNDKVKTPPSKRSKAMKEQPTPRSTRASRSQKEDGEATKTPQKTIPANSKEARTPRSKKRTAQLDHRDHCQTPQSKGVTMPPGGGFITPKSSRRRVFASGEDGTPRTSRRAAVRQPPYSMSTLCGWYRETSQDKDCRVPVVLFVEDFEEFSSKILQDLILSLVPHLSEFPVILILGMAVPASTLHQTFPQYVVSCLSIQQFCIQQPPITLSKIIANVLMSPSLPFKLGPKAFKFLTDQFLQSNFSLTGFTRGLKLALMEHFHWQPLSVLCSTSTLQGKNWPPMPTGFCESIRATPSFQIYVESLPPAQRLSMLTKDAAVMTAVKEMTRAMFEYQQVVPPLLRCLYHFTRSLPDAPLGDKLQDLYALSLEQNIAEQSKFKSAWTMVNMLGKDRLNTIVQLCTAEVRDARAFGMEATLLQDAHRIFSKYVEEMSQFSLATSKETMEWEERSLTSRHESSTSEDEPKHIGLRPSSKCTFESLRRTFLSYLLAIFSKLQAPHKLALHEAFYFNQASSLHQHLTPTPRSCLQRALTDPSHYISPRQQKKKGKGRFSGTAPVPDLCLLYTLYLESSKLISINDWLQSFVAVVRSDGGSKDGVGIIAEEETGKKSVDPVLHDRFHQALSELQLLGYVRQTQRKADHLQRLTLEQAKDEYTL